MGSAPDLPELGKDAVNWLIQKGLNTMSVGLAMHYYEIQKSWQSCGSDYVCKLEKLMLYFTAIFGGTSPAIAISELAAGFVNKAWGWVQTDDQPLMGKGSWGPAAINMMIYVYIEYMLSKMCDWVRYSTECLKQNVCENDNILVWIYNMKASYCNKTTTDVDVDVEVDCLEGECLDKEVDVPNVVYKITDNSDWCVIFFNEFPLLMLALLIWSAYIVSVHFKDDKVKSAQEIKVKGKAASGKSGKSSVDKKSGKGSVDKKSGSGKKKKGSGTGKGDSDDEESDDDKQESDDDKQDSDSDKGESDSDKQDSDSDKGKSESGKEDADSDKQKGGTGKKKRAYNKKGKSTDKKKGDSKTKSARTRGIISESSDDTQKVEVKCPTCGKIRDMCMPNPLPVFCDKCGPKMTSKVKTTRKTSDDGGFNKCKRKPKPKANLMTDEPSDDSESDDLSSENLHFTANNSTEGLSLAVAVLEKMVGDDKSDDHEDSSEDNYDDELLYKDFVNFANAHKNELASTLQSRCLICESYHLVHDHDEDSVNEDEENNNDNDDDDELYA